ncbi:MAG TPA: SPOR domain-containing protein [Candidatus Binataceae bacterium]|nr:SPOR domain-containing protein [Candidatus Binataceae bacterium]
MRFEIGAGGTIVILIGLVGLSGAVFGLGLVAGHELATQEPPAEQTASSVALPPAPALSGAATAASSAPGAGAPLADSASAPAPDNAPPVSPDAAVMPPAGMPVGDSGGAPAPASDHLHKTLASLRERSAGSSRLSNPAPERIPVAPDVSGALPPPSVDYVAPAPGGTNDHLPTKRAALAARKKVALNTQPKLAPAAHPEPYSVQIDAVMDRQGAEQMAAKLRARGFQPFIVQTQMAGQTWYRVRVGRYSTAQEAKAAEIRLHQEFGNSPLGR